MTKIVLSATVALFTLSGCATHVSSQEHGASKAHSHVSDAVIAGQRAKLSASVIGKNTGAHAPRDIDYSHGTNTKSTTQCI